MVLLIGASQADKSDDSLEEMTTRTVQHIKKRHTEEPGGAEVKKNPNEKKNYGEEADYDREQLAGPLSSRGVGKEDSAIHKGNTASEDAVRSRLHSTPAISPDCYLIRSKQTEASIELLLLGLRLDASWRGVMITVLGMQL